MKRGREWLGCGARARARAGAAIAIASAVVALVACEERGGETAAVLPSPGRDLVDGAARSAARSDDASLSSGGEDASLDAGRDIVGPDGAGGCSVEGRRFHLVGDVGCREATPTLLGYRAAAAEADGGAEVDGAVSCLRRPHGGCVVSRADPSRVYALTEDGPDPHVAGFDPCDGALAVMASQAPITDDCREP